MIRQPDFVTQEVFHWACVEASKKKKNLDFSKARFEIYEEGTCVQVLHVGPFSTESESITKIDEFIAKNQLVDDIGTERHHHEIYLGDPRKTAPERLKTVLRHPVKAK